MGAEINVVGIREPDADKFDAMWSILDGCRNNAVTIPVEIIAYFGRAVTEDADTRSEAWNMLSEGLLHEDSLTGDVEYGSGLIIDLKMLPPDFTKIRIHMED